LRKTCRRPTPAVRTLLLRQWDGTTSGRRHEGGHAAPLRDRPRSWKLSTMQFGTPKPEISKSYRLL
jgi:hypothetical protein